MLSLPRDVILLICKYFRRNYMADWSCERTYELYHLYASSKTFSWLANLEYVCIEPSDIYMVTDLTQILEEN